MIPTFTLCIDTRDQYNNTPLHYACSGGRLDVVQYLVEEAQWDISECIIILSVPVYTFVVMNTFRCTELQQSDCTSCSLHWRPIYEWWVEVIRDYSNYIALKVLVCNKPEIRVYACNRYSMGDRVFYEIYRYKRKGEAPRASCLYISIKHEDSHAIILCRTTPYQNV